MMRQYLIPESGNFYKANLHCHTTVSDGKYTPEEIKRIYQEKGYSIVAYTDHDVMIPHPELADDSFLPLLGYEMEVNPPREPGKGKFYKTCHMCLVALSPEAKQVCFHREKYFVHNAVNYRDQVLFDESLPDYEREYSHTCISDMMQKGREGGFFVTYNHPAWSLEEFPDYIGYEGMHAMEIYNTGCVVEGYEDECPGIYDDMLRHGKKLFCIAADDNHGDREQCGGFVMIKSDRLAYTDIADALVAGHFYASTGPEIKELYLEDGYVHIKTSPARKITVSTAIRASKVKHSAVADLTEASFPVSAENGYFRLTVEDAEGHRAYTNAYFL